MVGSTLPLKAGRWSDALTMEFERQRQPPPPDTHSGVRLSARERWPRSGARTTALSPPGGGSGQLLLEMGERLAYAHRLRRLRRLSKDVSRNMKGSHNRRKAIRRLWRHQTRMANLRRDVLHKLTTEIVRRAASIGIEALTDVFNGRVFRAIAELGVYEFRRQPEYLRPGEVADLRLDDIDWRGGTIEVRTRKNRRGALLPLPCVVGQALVDYLGGECPATDERRVFVQLLGARRGKPISSTACSGVVGRALRRAAVDTPLAGAYVFRHTLTSRMVQKGASLKEVAGVLGHRSLDTTRSTPI